MNVAWIVLIITSTHAQLNFYIDSLTLQDLFQINNYQLYFINQNDVRAAALDSSMQIPVNVDVVQINWNDERRELTKRNLFYEYNTSSSNEHDLLPPVLSIIEKGIVPRDISTFSILFPCLSTSVVNCSVTFRFYNASTNSTSTIINVKFSKFCRTETINHTILAQFYNPQQVHDYLMIKESRHSYFTSTTVATILAYSLIIAFFVFLIVFCAAMSLFCLYRISMKPNKMKSNCLIDDQQNHPALPLTFDLTAVEDVSLYSCTQYDFMKTADDILSSATFADCIIDQNRVTFHETIVEGTYGRLLHCSLHDSTLSNLQENTVGKTLHSTATGAQLNQMLHDACLFATLKHSTLNSPLGIVYNENFSPYPLIIYPYSNKGILKRFLIQNRTISREKMLSTQELVYMGIHVAKGLHFLHRRKMLMKDIGTRNCLVMDDLTVKLTDFALSRDLFPQDYDFLATDHFDESRPLKFFSMESISDRRFSTASDVWSYGVLLWELMSRGLQPYAEIHPDELLTHLQNNHRLIQPNNCPDSLFKLMSICWTASIDQRPSMTSLLHSLMEFYGQLARFI